MVTPVSPSCTALAQVVTCDGWPLAENRSIDFDVTLEAVVPDPGVELLASVSGDLPDPDPASNQTEVTVDGDSYTITGEAAGADMSNPMAGMITKPFTVTVTCS